LLVKMIWEAIDWLIDSGDMCL